jgi:hypothetical protein
MAGSGDLPLSVGGFREYWIIRRQRLRRPDCGSV